MEQKDRYVTSALIPVQYEFKENCAKCDITT